MARRRRFGGHVGAGKDGIPPKKRILGLPERICDKFFEITVDKLLCPHFTINEGGLKDEFMVC